MAEKCAFCDFPLTVDDLSSQSPHAWWKHCKEHANHATYPQLWLLKSELGVSFEEPPPEERVCAVCGTPLTEEEWSEVKKTSVNFVCRFHRRNVNDSNILLTRKKLGYSEYLQRPIYSMIKIWNL